MLRFSKGMMPRGSLSYKRWRELRAVCEHAATQLTLAHLPSPTFPELSGLTPTLLNKGGKHKCVMVPHVNPYQQRPWQGARPGPNRSRQESNGKSRAGPLGNWRPSG